MLRGWAGLLVSTLVSLGIDGVRQSTAVSQSFGLPHRTADTKSEHRPLLHPTTRPMIRSPLMHSPSCRYRRATSAEQALPTGSDLIGQSECIARRTPARESSPHVDSRQPTAVATAGRRETTQQALTNQHRSCSRQAHHAALPYSFPSSRRKRDRQRLRQRTVVESARRAANQQQLRRGDQPIGGQVRTSLLVRTISSICNNIFDNIRQQRHVLSWVSHIDTPTSTFNVSPDKLPQAILQ